MSNIYYLGGSPCCGKSTIAEKLSKTYGFQYYKADDFLDKFIKEGAKDGDEWLEHIATMTLDQLWLRDPKILNKEELITYEKIFPYFLSGLKKLNQDTPIITEGAAFLPRLINQIGIDEAHYICMVPSRKFQLHHFSKREWVNHYLSSCSDKEKAFRNWMERDALYAECVLKEARTLGYANLLVDGISSLDENYSSVVKAFGL